jgi:hypothetical protein
LILEQNVHGPLLSGNRLDQELQDNGLEVADAPRYTLLDDVDFGGKEIIDHLDDRLVGSFAYPIRIATLPLFPSRVFRRSAEANLVFRWDVHAFMLLPASNGEKLCLVDGLGYLMHATDIVSTGFAVRSHANQLEMARLL